VTTFDAVYRGGALHPLMPLGLAEGTPVRVTLESPTPVAPPGSSVFDIITAITARSVASMSPSARPDDVARNHDKYLYGDVGDRSDVR
jgi:predicted DNA-binding antitoxin AbrB/MazE fold protein